MVDRYDPRKPTCSKCGNPWPTWCRAEQHLEMIRVNSCQLADRWSYLEHFNVTPAELEHNCQTDLNFRASRIRPLDKLAIEVNKRLHRPGGAWRDLLERDFYQGNPAVRM